MKKVVLSLLYLFLSVFVFEAYATDAEALLPRTGITNKELAIVINENDEQSVRVGEYYQKARNIPDRNVIRVRFKPTDKDISVDDFKQLKSRVDEATPANIQAYAITWTGPYRVGKCMSITSAFAFGFDPAYCGQCKATKVSPYFNSSSLYPYVDLKIRPAMMLAGRTFESVKTLIDKGVSSDASLPKGKAYLLKTTDKARNVRAVVFDQAKDALDPALKVFVVSKNEISFKKNVMFYFTGVANVAKLNTLNFLPGAFGDHLTSWGGGISEKSGQTTVLDWLEAGVSASYGTVTEPCNHIQKFPMPSVAMFHYLVGSTAIEAYWKSVLWPGEGLFVGDPLAKPYAPQIKLLEDGRYELKMHSPNKRTLLVLIADSAVGPYKAIAQQNVIPGLNVMTFKLNQQIGDRVLKLRWQ